MNSAIRRNAPAETRVMALDEAVAAGAMSLFGEKYESDVRVLSFGDFSMELCGGTHVERAGDIGLFKIISESGVAAGIRRVEAVTGQAAYEWVVRRRSGAARYCCAASRQPRRRGREGPRARRTLQAAGKGSAAAQVETGQRAGRRFVGSGKGCRRH